MLEARLQKRYKATKDCPGFELNVNFTAGTGVTVLFGPSGSGKSLTLDLIAGFSRPDAGRVLLNDRLLADVGTGVALPPQQRGCGYLFQRPALFPHLTVRRNLALAAARLPKLERHRKVGQLLEIFRLGELAERRPAELSGGQRQRAAIARCLVVEPEILLLDEPSVGLDTALRHDFYDALAASQAEFAVPVLLVTHDLEEAFLLADQMLVLVGGRLVQTGTPRQILEQPASVVVAELLGLFNLLPAEIRHLDPGANRSRLRWNEVDLEGPYYPARLLGDRVTVCVRRDEILASPKMGKVEKGTLVMNLESASETPRSALLHFEESLIVEMPIEEYAGNRHHREWVLKFPVESLRLV